MPGVFISYRREDSAGHAGRLFDRLSSHFGKDRVFMDVSDIEPGTDFVEAIDKAVGSCDVLVVVIGKEWLTCTDAAGRRRLENPSDFIRLETVTALRRNVRVIPVLVQGAAMPDADNLPEDLKNLARRQAVEISDTRWDSDVSRLVATLDRLPAAREAAEADQPAVATRKGLGGMAMVVTAIFLVILGIVGVLMWPARGIEVPAVVGKSVDQAKAILGASGLTPGAIDERQTEEKPAGTVLAQDPDPGAKIEKGGQVNLIVAALPDVTVPSVVQETIEKAEVILKDAGLALGKRISRETSQARPGTVLSQIPLAGEKLPRGNRIDLVVATTWQVTVPDVVRKRIEDATSSLKEAGLIPQVSRRETRAVPLGTVLEQKPGPGEKVGKDTKIELAVAVPPSIPMPRVVGMTVADARALLERKGIVLGAIEERTTGRTPGTVIGQEPRADVPIADGKSAKLVVEAKKQIVTRSRGSLSIPQTWTVDLDDGKVGARQEADIWFEAVTATERYLTPQNRSLIAVVRQRIAPEVCAQATLSAARIPIRDLPQSTYVCVRTNQGRFSAFRVNEAVGPSPGTLKISYVTWN
jgi:beta-lactam-binding protein with PASTA domain